MMMMKSNGRDLFDWAFAVQRVNTCDAAGFP
jgi:hypothetical protein